MVNAVAFADKSSPLPLPVCQSVPLLPCERVPGSCAQWLPLSWQDDVNAVAFASKASPAPLLPY